ncbi:MAG: raffinose/stachyose/melibiose transport system substrate-binding protein, partial [Thermomicrobiales bacterium]|nr:raffinose/stachyose/melibiose transport system substrate-binding protein [Thermomicrobiales bacterium]
MRPLFLPLAVVMLLLGLAIAPLSGVGRANAQDKVELRIWDQFTGPETEVVDEIYKAFTEQNPNITITRESVQTDQMRQTVNTALASGTGPDIIFYDAGPGYAGVLANAGLLAPLEEFATQYGWKDKIAGPSLEATSLNGQLY